MMKTAYRRFLALVLTLVLLLGMTVPAQAQTTQIQQITPLTATVTAGDVLNVAGWDPSDTNDYLTSLEAVADAVRQGFENREPVVVVPYTTTSYDEQMLQEVFNMALAHTGVPTQGDYLRWQLGPCDIRLNGYSVGSVYYLTLTFTPGYYTTAQQEAQLDEAVAALLDELDVYDATDYEKVCAIYDYICSHVTYDYDGLAAQDSSLIYTAYAALINGTAVCQGYANLFYRLALELDVDTRLIAGVGKNERHGWNIVKLGEKYYNVDATWDAPRAQADMEYDYFLRCDDHFANHTPDGEYLTEAFQTAYPKASADFTLSTEPVAGDIDRDEQVSRNDVVRLLLHVTMPNRFQITVAADFTGDGHVDRNDVVRLLLHVTLPNRFPL